MVFLVELYTLTGNLGAAIIIFTILIRSILIPLSLPSLKAFQKMRELQPELKKLKQKHSDKQEFAKAQMELYKKYNVNPLAGCAPQIIQMGVLFLLYHVLTTFLKTPVFQGIEIKSMFLWLDLSQRDHTLVLPFLAAATQLILSLMLAPATETPDIVPNKSTLKKVQEANKKEEDTAEMAQTMQQQMIFMMPVIVGISAAQFPSGLALYWVITTIFSIAQQYFISGWGGLLEYPQRVKQYFVKKG